VSRVSVTVKIGEVKVRQTLSRHPAEYNYTLIDLYLIYKAFSDIGVLRRIISNALNR